MLTTALLALAAVLLDGLLGEPRRWHPLVGFGKLAERLERRLHGGNGTPPRARRMRGVLGVLALLLPFTAAAARLDDLLNFIPARLAARGGWLIVDEAFMDVTHEALARQGILTRLFIETSSLRFGLPGDEMAWARLDAALSGLTVQHPAEAVL